MITRFKYIGFEVTLDDSEGVICQDPDTKQLFEMQMGLGQVEHSMALTIAMDLKESGAIDEFTAIDDKTIY